MFTEDFRKDSTLVESSAVDISKYLHRASPHGRSRMARALFDSTSCPAVETAEDIGRGPLADGAIAGGVDPAVAPYLEPFMVLGWDGGVVYANEAACEAVGQPLSGKARLARVEPDGRAELRLENGDQGFDVSVVSLEDGSRLVKFDQSATVQDLYDQNRRLRQTLRKMVRRHRRFVESVSDYIYRVRIRNGVATTTTHNRGCEAVTGYPGEAFRNDPFLWINMVHPDDRPLVADFAQRATRGEPVKPYEHRIIRRDGSVRWVRNTSVQIFEDDRLVGIEGLVKDVTENKLKELEARRVNERLLKSNRALQSFLSEDAILADISNEMQSVWSADRAAALLGHSLPKVFAQSVGAVILKDGDRGGEVFVSWGETSGEAPAWVDELKRPPADGRVSSQEVDGLTQLSAVIRTIDDTTGLLVIRLPEGVDGADHPHLKRKSFVAKVADLIGLFLNNVRLRESLERQATQDPLTGLLNRRAMAAEFDLRFRDAERIGSGIGLIMLDLDHFKWFNDSFGHEAGDEVLRTLGALLKENTRAQDVVCRYGGEEFLVMLDGVSPETARRRAEQLRVLIGKMRVEFPGVELPPITASLGLGLYPSKGKAWKEVLQATDGALYQAKAAGRNQVVVA